MRVAVYARYSSDNQRATSIDDQLRELRAYAKKRGWKIVKEYQDYEKSGEYEYERPGFNALMHDARNGGRFDVVLGEDQDRFNRNLGDSSRFYDRLSFLGIKLHTIQQGEISLMHVAINGLQNQQYLENLRHKTKRGMVGAVLRGQSGGGIGYGYTNVTGKVDKEGKPVNGLREVNEAEAAIVRRIFTMYINGTSPKMIAKTLNEEGIPGPGKRKTGAKRWNPSTIHGNAELGLGILHNETYIGRIVWGRQRWVKNPDTGKRVSRLNDKSEWIVSEVKELRIVTQGQWEAVQARSAKRKEVYKQTGNPSALAVAARYLFSGLTKCSECGAGFVLNHGRLSCFGQRECGSCTNTVTITREKLEARVLAAIQTKLMQKDLFTEFCATFTDQLNKRQMAASAALSGAKSELEHNKAQAKKLLDLMLKDIDCKDEFNALKARQRELEALIENTAAPKALLHPSMADTFRHKVEKLASALQRPGARAAAAESMRGLIDEITIGPDPETGAVKIELTGNLAAMLTLATDGKKVEIAEVGPVLQQIAGGGLVLYRVAA